MSWDGYWAGGQGAEVGGTLRSHTRPSGKLIHRLYFMVLLPLVKMRGVCFGPHHLEVHWRSRATGPGPRGLRQEERLILQAATRRGAPDASTIETQGKGRRWPRVSGMPHMLKALAAVQLGLFLPPEEPRKIEGPQKASLSEAVFRLQKGKDVIRWKRPADRLICLCFMSVKSSNRNHKTLFWHEEPCLCLSLGCLKFIIPGGKLSLHCKYTDCFIYNFIGCLDPRLLRCSHFYETGIQVADAKCALLHQLRSRKSKKEPNNEYKRKHPQNIPASSDVWNTVNT